VVGARDPDPALDEGLAGVDVAAMTLAAVASLFCGSMVLLCRLAVLAVLENEVLVAVSMDKIPVLLGLGVLDVRGGMGGGCELFPVRVFTICLATQRLQRGAGLVSIGSDVVFKLMSRSKQTLTDHSALHSNAKLIHKKNDKTETRHLRSLLAILT
jgi:hypothetical protein